MNLLTRCHEGPENMHIRKSNMTKVCHVTSAHGRYDVRIFHKQCKSLAANGYDVTLLVNDGIDNETIDGVHIRSTHFHPRNRFERMIISRKLIKDRALEIDADIYHFHDPELLPIGVRLKKLGKTVIFDSHEDYLLTIADKNWIPRLLRPIVRTIYGCYEKHALKRIDGAIVCYHWTEERYRRYCRNVQMVLNFPIVHDEQISKPDFSRRAVCFAGGISPQWCHKEILLALSSLDNVKYELAGRLSGEYSKSLQQMDSWEYVNYHGVIPQVEVFRKVYANSSIGMALLDYVSQCKGTVGNLSNTKFFEYMYVGLPLICTDFDLWTDIVEEENCGITVNPHNIDEISDAISYLLENPEIAEQMGINGRRAVFRKYNWKIEEAKLLEFYSLLCD